MKDIIIGGGEVGSALYDALKNTTKDFIVIDKEKSKTILKQDTQASVFFLHICIPYTKSFEDVVLKYANKYEPKAIIIHSTVPPRTGEKLQRKYDIPIISSPIRGKHVNFVNDLKKYIKFYGFNGMYDKDVEIELWNTFTEADIPLKEMSNGRTCELAKIIVDTTYYGWKLVYRFLSHNIANNYNVEPNEMWEMNSDANQPINYADPKGIGGHCVLPNLELCDDFNFTTIASMIKNYNKYWIERNDI